MDILYAFCGAFRCQRWNFRNLIFLFNSNVGTYYWREISFIAFHDANPTHNSIYEYCNANRSFFMLLFVLTNICPHSRRIAPTLA